MSKIRAAGYCGGNTSLALKHDKSMAINRQKRAILNLQDEKQYAFTRFYMEKKKPDKHDDDREQLGLLLKDARDRAFDMVIVKRPDCLSRDTFYRLWVEKELLKCGVTVTALEPLPDDEQNKADAFLRPLMLAFADFENPRPLPQPKADATPATGKPKQRATEQSAYGWRKIKINGTSRMIPHQEEQEHLAAMHSHQRNGLSDEQIAELLNEGGFVGDIWFDRAPSRNAAPWDAARVRAALDHVPASE